MSPEQGLVPRAGLVVVHMRDLSSTCLGDSQPICSRLSLLLVSLKHPTRPHPGIPDSQKVAWLPALCTAGQGNCCSGSARPCSLALPLQVRLQVQNTEKPQYRGTLHCFQSIIKQESVSARVGQL